MPEDPAKWKFYEDEITSRADQAKSISRKAEDENRGMNEDERKEVDRLISEAEHYKHRLQESKDNAKLVEKIGNFSSFPGGEPTDIPADPKDWAEAFFKSQAWEDLKSKDRSSIFTTRPVEFGQKLTDAGLSVVSIADAGGTLPLSPQVAPIVAPAEITPRIAALFGQGNATSNTIVYLEETTTTPGALDKRYSDSDSAVTLTSEGAAKPAAYVNFTKRSKALEKIAAFLPIADEMLEDEPAIASYINGRLALFVRQAEDAYVFDQLFAVNMATTKASDIGTVGNWYDAIAAGIERVQRGGGLNPDQVLMYPTDYWKMLTTKASTAGTYFGDPFAASARNPWGVNVVPTPAVLPGTAIVGAFRDGATLWRKGGISVEASNSHSDYFRKNLTAIRAEERLALTVYRPAAFARTTIA